MAIDKDVLDRLLEGRDPSEVFARDGLLDDLKKALSERMATPSSRHRSRSPSAMVLSARMSSGVWAWVQRINGGWTSLRRHPCAMRAVCRAAFSPSEPAQIIWAKGRPPILPKTG